jgi:hypothetical protein
MHHQSVFFQAIDFEDGNENELVGRIPEGTVLVVFLNPPVLCSFMLN